MAIVTPNKPWLAQGDIFRAVLSGRIGVAGTPTQRIEIVPAMLISHGCAIDKKAGSGASKLQYLSFLPLQDVTKLENGRDKELRKSSGSLRPYEAMYLGVVPEVGESYVMLTEPYTLPAVLLQTELKHFSSEETGDVADDRIVAKMHDTRVGSLSAESLELFLRKWRVQWTRSDDAKYA